jgi:bifunctional ADP-heptose synthase (sugar kinase/adenylyltransferase)
MDTRTKILGWEAAQKVAAQLRREGRTLRVAAGSFDILQASQAQFLRNVRSDGESLLVAVYDDASLDNPILPAHARAQLVAALRVVDYVLVWPQERRFELCEGLQIERLEEAPAGSRNIIGEVLERHR